MRRKTAAVLAGLLGAGAPPGLLDELFAAEEARDRAARDDDARFDAQSVVEDLVTSAARWCRTNERREAGLALSRKVVERTVRGQYWNSAASAMETLVRHAPAQSRALLARFRAWANGPAPLHPSRPSFRHERLVADALAAGKLSGDLERAIDAQDASEKAGLSSDEDRRALAALLGAAAKLK